MGVSPKRGMIHGIRRVEELKLKRTRKQRVWTLDSVNDKSSKLKAGVLR